MKQRIGEYAAALGTIAFMVILLTLIFGNIGNGPAQVGTVQVRTQAGEVVPLENEIYRTDNNTMEEGNPLVLETAAERAPSLEYDNTITIVYDGGSGAKGGFYFTIYHEDLSVFQERQDAFTLLAKPGKYLLRFEAYWGTEKTNIGMEYFVWLEVK